MQLEKIATAFPSKVSSNCSRNLGRFKTRFTMTKTWVTWLITVNTALYQVLISSSGRLLHSQLFQCLNISQFHVPPSRYSVGHVLRRLKNGAKKTSVSHVLHNHWMSCVSDVVISALVLNRAGTERVNLQGLVQSCRDGKRAGSLSLLEHVVEVLDSVLVQETHLL